MEGIETGGFLGAGEDGGDLTGTSLAGLEITGAFGSGTLKLTAGLFGSETGFGAGSNSVGLLFDSIGLVGRGCALVSGNLLGATVFEFTIGCLNLFKTTPSVDAGGVGIGFGARFK